MRSVTEIRIRVETWAEDDRLGDSKHAEISIEGACVTDAMEEFGHPSLTDIIRGANYVAGILGRLSVVATPWVFREAVEHRCIRGELVDEDGNFGFEACYLTGPLQSVLDPSHDTGDPPALWIYVPTERVQEWEARVRNWLATIYDSLAWTEEPQPLRAVRGAS